MDFVRFRYRFFFWGGGGLFPDFLLLAKHGRGGFSFFGVMGPSAGVRRVVAHNADVLRRSTCGGFHTIMENNC